MNTWRGDRPEFVRPGIDVLQAYFAPYAGQPGRWHDVQTILDERQLAEAAALVDGGPWHNRIVRRQGGGERVIYPVAGDGPPF